MKLRRLLLWLLLVGWLAVVPAEAAQLSYGINIKVPDNFQSQSTKQPASQSALQQFLSRYPQLSRRLESNKQRAVLGNLAVYDPASQVFIITSRGRYWAVTVDAQTVYRQHALPIKPTDLHPGDTVLAFGRPDRTQNAQVAYIIKKIR